MSIGSVLVTGADGIVGRGVVQCLVSRGYSVIAVSRRNTAKEQPFRFCGDLTDDRFLKCLEGNQISSIIHLAASVPHNTRYSPEENYSVTSKIDKNLAKVQREHSAHLTYMSTCGLYDRNSNVEKTEKDKTVVYSPYFQAKLEGEQLFQNNGKSTILRLSAPIGLTLLDNLVLGKFVKAARMDKVLYVWSNGTREQNFIDCEDVNELLLKCVEQKPNGVFNCASRNPIDMTSLAKLIIEIFGSGKLEYENHRDPLEGEKARYSIEKARDQLGWSPNISISDSIKRIQKSWRL
jgi:nucleoside-diphosphate-sugar epimerase